MPRIAVSGNKTDLASRLTEDDALPYLADFDAGAQTVPPGAPGEVSLTIPDDSGIWSDKTVSELKAEIRKRNMERAEAGDAKLSLGGKKHDLIRRLLLDDSETPH